MIFPNHKLELMKVPMYFLLCLFVLNTNAQGIHFSDHREMPIQLNPAFTGIIHNDYLWRAGLAHRRQGNAILGTYEFETTYMYFDRKFSFCNSVSGMFAGLGVEVLHDQVGHTFTENPQYFHRQEAKLNASLGLQISKRNHLIAGVKLGLLSHGLSDQELKFDNQFNGRNFDPTRSSMESFESTRFNYFDMGLGVLMRGSFGTKSSSSFIGIKTFEIGVSILHLVNSRKKFLVNSPAQDLVKEYRFHIKANMQFMKKGRIVPSLIIYAYDSPFTNSKQWQIRSSVEFPVLSYIMFSGGLRISNFAERGNNPDALVFTLKWKPYTDSGKDNLIVGVAFDLNISPNSVRATNGYGGIEVFATHYFGSSKDSVLCCPWSNTTNHVFY